MITQLTTFKQLHLQGWRQFDDVTIDLHPNLTILAGANGSGKTSLLNLFSQHFGWGLPYLATPRRGDDGGYTYFSGVRDFSLKADALQRSQIEIGHIVYSTGHRTPLVIQANQAIQYNIAFGAKPDLFGFHIPSHRSPPVYRAVELIPTQPMLPDAAFNVFAGAALNRYRGGWDQNSPMFRMKEAIISMATFGPGNQYTKSNSEVLECLEGFIAILRKVMPETLGFTDLSIRMPDIVLVTKSGDFLLDAASGGLLALIDLAWQIYMFSKSHACAVVTIDEPENHLHPSMQRSLLGNLVKAFPKNQFIVATHSPFIVSAVQDSTVYALQYFDTSTQLPLREQDIRLERSVRSMKLDSFNRSGNAAEILRDVLGVRVTVPEWVESRLNQIVSIYRDKEFNAQTLADLRSELSALGYGDLFPDVIAEIVPHHD